jgi:Zinc knuckle
MYPVIQNDKAIGARVGPSGLTRGQRPPGAFDEDDSSMPIPDVSETRETIDNDEIDGSISEIRGHTSVNPDDITAWIPREDQEPFDYAYFLSWVKGDPERCWKMLKQLWRHDAGLSRTCQTIEEDLKDTGERAKALQKEIATLKREMREASGGTRQPTMTPMTGTPGPSGMRSAKQPDPPCLTDGKDPSYQTYKLRMQSKLRSNRDYFVDEQAMIDYIFSRTEGEAARYMETWIMSGELDCVEMVFGKFNEIFLDPHRRAVAAQEHRKLHMKTTDEFHEFVTIYRRMALEAEYPEKLWIDDFHEKMTFHLQEKTMAIKMNATNFNAYVTEVGRMAMMIKHLDTERNKFRTRSGQPSGRQNRDSKEAKEGRPYEKKPEKRTGRAGNEGPLPHHAEMTCFNCNEKGHIGRFCPKPKSVVRNVEENGDASLSEDSKNE